MAGVTEEGLVVVWEAEEVVGASALVWSVPRYPGLSLSREIVSRLPLTSTTKYLSRTSYRPSYGDYNSLRIASQRTKTWVRVVR